MRFVVRLITTLLGLAAAAAGVVLVVEAVGALVRPGTGGLIVPWQRIHAALSVVSWDDAPVRAIAAGVLVAGLLLLLIAMTSGRREIRLHDPAPEVTVTTDPRSLARLVGHQVRDQDGVATASVTASAKRVQVRASSQFRDAGDLQGRLTEAAKHAVQELPLRDTPKVLVSVSTPKERR
ncbi:hypothetical protein SAMN02982929_04812 [Saccharopolyspora kobensis]|uniref:DUF6286 domain-containing protein n=1 Tax=Saccharopolyspora kobensis TaxID=146035 RepID=A0A1H6DS78_9PSEU|nr:DUF6286 domain-containing protein [Saccharopolyspora kobensis]SEG87586.1 hypothetical protein SAMN02982929_04812 [Saccharopolyspora kobensis]SFE05933.1 hypothetical protein SAMN05216506_108216 [Saccharopolyspora kobensis]